MKYVLRALMCFFIAISIPALAHAAASEDGKDSAADAEGKSSWELEKADDELGIRVYTREVAGSDLREFRGVTKIKSNLTGPIALIEDVRHAPDWMHNCSSVKILENVVPGEIGRAHV